MKCYLTRRRARFKGLSGPVDIPDGTALEGDETFIFYKGKPLCAAMSKNAHDCIVLDNDGNGAQRGRLIDSILSALKLRDDAYQVRWNRIWGDTICEKYRRKDHNEIWLWSHEFYSAPLFDLQYIAGLIGIGAK